MKDKILGGIGVLWGGGLVVRWLLTDEQSTNSAYQAGQDTAVMFGAVMLVIGAYYLFRKSP